MKDALRKCQAIRSGFRLFRDPTRLNEVFKLADSVVRREDEEALARRLSEIPEVKKAFEEKPRIGRIDRQYLSQLPEGSLGKSFYEFIVANKICPEDIPSLPTGDEVDYIKAHLYETHDLYHVVLGFGTDLAGEVGVQGFYASQMLSRQPLVLIGLSTFNTLFFSFEDYEGRFDALVKGWTLGKRSKLLFGTKWADLWETQLSEIRQSFNIDLSDFSLPVIPIQNEIAKGLVS